MGLDMYLSASKHIHKYNWKESTRDNRSVNPEFDSLITMTKLDNVQTEEDIYGASIEVVCAYWRKVNAVHAWFVANIQDGKDDCGIYYVSVENLRTLRDLCQRVIDEKRPNLLWPQEGPFFGSTDIDSWYWENIEETIKKLNRIIDLPDVADLSFTYHSSW